MLRITDVISQLQQFWNESAPAGSVTQFPGVPLDAAPLDSWYEFWVTQMEESPHRSTGVDRLRLMIDLHCFARGADKRKAAGLAQSAQAALSHTELPLHSVEADDSPTGWLRLRECRLRDLTRESSVMAQLPLQHVMVSLIAVVEELAPAVND